jgi:hypothetical protein
MLTRIGNNGNNRFFVSRPLRNPGALGGERDRLDN